MYAKACTWLHSVCVISALVLYLYCSLLCSVGKQLCMEALTPQSSAMPLQSNDCTAQPGFVFYTLLSCGCRMYIAVSH
jgi:hypothetical protein